MRFGKLFVLALSTLVAASAARAEEPSFVVYHQGRLLRADDQPATEIEKVRVSIFANEATDTAVWTEEYPIVVASNGLYAVALGDTKGGRKAITPTDLAGERWISVTVGAAELKPRVRLGSTPYALVALDSNRLGGTPAADFLKKNEFETFKTAITGGGSGSITVPWSAIRDIPTDFGAGLREVAVTGSTLSGNGTASNPLKIADASVDSTQLKNGAVTAAKLASNGCGEGQVLKFQSGAWQCGSDIGGGDTLPFDVLAPLEQIAGTGGSSAKLAMKDGGVSTVKLANDAVDATKLAADARSLAKLSAGAFTTTAAGSVGVGISSPTARLEVGDFADAGSAGSGTIQYNANTTTISITGGTFTDQVRAGDSIQLSDMGWRTVVAVPTPTSLTINASYSLGWGGSWSYRRATLRLGQIQQTATGDVGIGRVPTNGRLDVQGDVNASGLVKQAGAALVPAGAVMYFAIANCPAGWVKANGQSLQSSQYPALAQAFGATGASFTVPDLRGEFLRGADDGRGVDGGRAVGSLQGDATKVWMNGSSKGNNPIGDSSTGIITHQPGAWMAGIETGTWSGNFPNRVTLQAAFDSRYGNGSETRPRNVALLGCIKF